MQRRRSINSYIGWHQVLPLIDVETVPGSMPMTAQCPLCRGSRLHIYDDSKFGGNWHYCPDCKSAGGMIELAAKAWKVDMAQAIRRLVDAGAPIPEESITPAHITEYIDECPGQQERCVALAQDACRMISAGRVKVTRLLQQMGLPQDQQRNYWPQRMGRFMGSVNSFRAVKAFLPNATPHNYTGRKGPLRLFPNGKWKDVITVPFHDLPGRCSGVLFVGYQAKRDKDYVFKIVDSGARAGPSPQVEAGVCMYDVMDGYTAYPQQFSNNVIVFDDPVNALKLQARHMRDSDAPLPLVGAYPAIVKRGERAWRLVAHELWYARPDKKFIFWGPLITPELYDMASRADGQVCISNMPSYQGREQPHNTLQWIQDHAAHWSESLESQLRALPERAAVELLQRLTLPPDMVQRFKAECGPQVRKLLDTFQRDIKLLSTTTIDGKAVSESDAGWYLSKSGECVSDAILRIEKVICQQNDPESEPYYQGRILYRDEQIEFTERMDVLDKAPGAWIKRKVLAECGKLVTIKRGWAANLVDIARMFYDPQVVSEDGRFGWKSTESRFALPNFSVHLGGTVKVAAAHVVDDCSPGRALVWPDTREDAAALLRDTPSNKVFWATAACLGANIIAPPTGRPEPGLGLIGNGALLVGKAAARACGCHEIRYSSSRAFAAKLVAKIEAVQIRHRWPVIVSLNHNYSYKNILGLWLNGSYPRNVVTYFDALQADFVGMLDPWRFIRCDDPIEAGPPIQMCGRHIIPMWLARISGQKLELQSDAELYSHQVLDDMAHMMSQYGDPETIHEARALIDDNTDRDDDQASKFVDFLYKCVEDGFIRTEHAGHKATAAASSIVSVADGKRAPGVFVSREIVAQAAGRRTMPLPDPGRITDALRAANALDCECEYNGDVGWFIIEAWWARQIQRCQARFQRRLKVIGGA